MDPKPPSDHYALAPPAAGSSAAVQLPGEHQAWPRVDDHLVTPETREECVRGHEVLAVPANLPHGKHHCELDYVIRGNVADGYHSATDLLTRVGPESNFATDTCIVREGIDPSTGARWLEELAFEVVAEQPIRKITERAADLTARGVRRLIAIFVKKGEVCEWSPAMQQWQPLDPDDDLVDSTLRRPLKVRALLDAAEADDAVARGLKAKRNRVIEALEAAQREQGRREGLRRSIELVCTQLAIPWGDEQHTRLQSLDDGALERLLGRLLAEQCWPE